MSGSTAILIETGDKLAELRPDLVSYSVYPDTIYASAWNVDSARYMRKLTDFLLIAVK